MKDAWFWIIIVLLGIGVSEYVAFVATRAEFVASLHQLFPWIK